MIHSLFCTGLHCLVYWLLWMKVNIFLDNCISGIIIVPMVGSPDHSTTCMRKTDFISPSTVQYLVIYCNCCVLAILQLFSTQLTMMSLWYLFQMVIIYSFPNVVPCTHATTAYWRFSARGWPKLGKLSTPAEDRRNHLCKTDNSAISCIFERPYCRIPRELHKFIWETCHSKAALHGALPKSNYKVKSHPTNQKTHHKMWLILF